MRVGVPVETDRKTRTSTCASPSPSRPGPVGYDGADCHAPASPSDDTFLAPLDPKSTEFVLVKACATCADEGEGLRDREITIMFPPAIFHMLFAGRTGNGKCCLVIPCFVFGQQQCTEKKIIHRVPRIYEHFPSHRTHADGVILSDVRGRQPPPLRCRLRCVPASTPTWSPSHCAARGGCAWTTPAWTSSSVQGGDQTIRTNPRGKSILPPPETWPA